MHPQPGWEGEGVLRAQRPGVCPGTGTGHTPPDSMPGAQGVDLASSFIQIPVECLLCARHRARRMGCPESRPPAD